MAAHRYWRATRFEAYATGDLELSALQLVADGVRVDAPATLSANTAPDVSGALANLQDTDLSTAARWSAQAARTLAIDWDFGASPQDVATLRPAGDSHLRYPLFAQLQWSDDAVVWEVQDTYLGIAWPGAGVLAPLALNTLRGAMRLAEPPVMPLAPVPPVYGLMALATPPVLPNEMVLGTARGRIRGTVKVTPNTPVRRKVRLIREVDGQVIREQWSDPVTGAYDFQFVDDLRKWTVVSYDFENLFRAVIADNLTPELMP
jgi:hypothetical protein